jgi:hypothetical protein
VVIFIIRRLIGSRGALGLLYLSSVRDDYYGGVGLT